MKLSITYIELKGPFHFFALSVQALKVVQQLKKTSCIKYKNTGFWTKHYTMTLWDDMGSMHDFVKSGAHLEAMKNSSKIAKEIKVITVDSDELISWKEAKNLLNNSEKVKTY